METKNPDGRSQTTVYQSNLNDGSSQYVICFVTMTTTAWTSQCGVVDKMMVWDSGDHDTNTHLPTETRKACGTSKTNP